MANWDQSSTGSMTVTNTQTEEKPPAYDSLWEQKEGSPSEKSGKYPEHYGAHGGAQGNYGAGGYGSSGQAPSAPPPDGAYSNIYPGKWESGN